MIRQYSYAGEGWGLTNNGNDLYMSDGSAEIRVIDSSNFKEKRRIKVHDGSKPVDQLNELEYIDGELFANIWQTDRIARISPQTGEVVGWIEVSLAHHLQSEPFGLIGGLVVQEGVRGGGIGRRLCQEAERWTREQGIAQIRVTSRSTREAAHRCAAHRRG